MTETYLVHVTVKNGPGKKDMRLAANKRSTLLEVKATGATMNTLNYLNSMKGLSYDDIIERALAYYVELVDEGVCLDR